jgi:hypothetical protein
MLVNPHKTEWQDWHFRTTLQDQKEGKAVLQDLVKVFPRTALRHHYYFLIVPLGCTFFESHSAAATCA